MDMLWRQRPCPSSRREAWQLLSAARAPKKKASARRHVANIRPARAARAERGLKSRAGALLWWDFSNPPLAFSRCCRNFAPTHFCGGVRATGVRFCSAPCAAQITKANSSRFPRRAAGAPGVFGLGACGAARWRPSASSGVRSVFRSVMRANCSVVALLDCDPSDQRNTQP